MNDEMSIYEENEVEEVYEDDDYESKGSGLSFGKIALIGTAIAATAAAVIYKNRDKIEARRIKKLRKKGYVVYRTEEDELIDACISEECDDAE